MQREEEVMAAAGRGVRPNWSFISKDVFRTAAFCTSVIDGLEVNSGADGKREPILPFYDRWQYMEAFAHGKVRADVGFKFCAITPVGLHLFSIETAAEKETVGILFMTLAQHLSAWASHQDMKEVCMVIKLHQLWEEEARKSEVYMVCDMETQPSVRSVHAKAPAPVPAAESGTATTTTTTSVAADKGK